MKIATQQRLMEVNRTFYSQVATAFDQTRAGLPLGWQQLAAYMPSVQGDGARWVLDAGCGNGRFARALAHYPGAFHYVGVDGDATLLALAAEQSVDLPQLDCHFLQADLTVAGWSARLQPLTATFALIVCFAALHHVPGYALRLQVLRQLAALLAEGGVLILSNWQFLTSNRFAQKQIDWSTVGLSAQEMEPGDALLPWQQGGFAIRYVHQVDEAEVAQLARDTNLRVVDTFYADGKEGNLNLYSVLKQTS